MNDSKSDASDTPENGSIGERAYYLVPSSQSSTPDSTGIDVGELIGLVWNARWAVITIATVFAGGGVAYALLAQARYSAEVSLLPSENRSGSALPGALGQLGGLASLAGINIGSGNRAEPLAVLRSRDLTAAFIERNNLLPVLFSDQWDAKSQSWKVSAEDQPDIRDAVLQFDKSVRKVVEDRKTGLIKVVVEWKEPALAAAWANGYVKLLNERMRARALEESDRNMAYLSGQLREANQVSIQQAAGRLLQGELEKSMIAKGSEDFAFRVVDPAVVPKLRIWPRRTLIVLLSGLMGGMAGTAFALVRGLLGNTPPKAIRS